MKIILNDPTTLARLFTPNEIRKLKRAGALHINRQPTTASHPDNEKPTTSDSRG